MVDALENLRTPLLLLAVLANGLQAGTYYTWASGVMPGLARTDDRTFVHAMQQANVAIVNPVFLATFVGAPLLAGLGLLAVDASARAWTIAGLLLAIVTVLVTMVGNIPLNDALDAAGPVDAIADLAAVREAFERPWVMWNVVRTLTSTGALGCLAVAMAR